MKVGIISDIHGNHYALREVLKTAKKDNVEFLLVLGDIVGYYYHPDKILDMLDEWPHELIKGNHEAILEDLKLGKIDAVKLKEKYGSGHELALEKLSEETQQYLFSLPEQRSVTLNGVTFQMNHGAPWSIDEYIYPDAASEKLESCNSKEHDFVLIGHSHYSFSFRCTDSILINSGSVGQSRQKGGVAFWTVVNTQNKSFSTMATPYDPSALLQEVSSLDPEVAYSSKILSR